MHVYKVLVYKILGVSTLALALAMPQPILAKSKTGGSGGEPQSLSPASPTPAQILDEAVRLCELVADNKRAILDALETQGWQSDVTYDVGNAPFYKEIFASNSYEGVGDLEIWGYLENYPGFDIGYCAYSIVDPQIRINIAPIDQREGYVGEMEIEGRQVYGAWRDLSNNPTTFIHAYQNLDTFVYQITRITKTN